MHIEQILEEYRRGDDSKRLSLFLAHRDLRDDFSRIDQESDHEDFVLIHFPWHRKHPLPNAA